MEPAPQDAQVTRQQLPVRPPPRLVGQQPLLRLLQKISSLALNLLLIRVLSATGFIVALWLCPVQIFADVGLYLASLSLAALAVFGRYELLVVGASDDQQCTDAVYLCTLTAAAAIAIALLVAVAVNQSFVREIAECFAAALFARAWLRLGLTFATRHGRNARAVKALFPHAIGQPFVLVLLLRHGYEPLIAFVLSDIIGHLIAAAGVCVSEWRAFRRSFQLPIRYRQIGKLARANFRLPTVNLTATASAFLFAMTPLVFLPGLANGVLAGTLALLFRILDVPTSLTSASLAPILMKEVVDRKHDGSQRMLRSTFLLPGIAAITVFGLITLGGLTLNRLHLAPEWHLALTILPVVALFQASIAATAPLIDVATLANRQQGLLAFNILAVGTAGAVFLLWNNDPVFAIVLAGSVGFARVIGISIWLLASTGHGYWHSRPMTTVRIRA